MDRMANSHSAAKHRNIHLCTSIEVHQPTLLCHSMLNSWQLLQRNYRIYSSKDRINQQLNLRGKEYCKHRLVSPCSEKCKLGNYLNQQYKFSREGYKQDNWHQSRRHNSRACSHKLEDHYFDCYQRSSSSLLQTVNRIGIDGCMKHSQLHRCQNNLSRKHNLVGMTGSFLYKLNNMINLSKQHIDSRKLLYSLLSQHQCNQWHNCNQEAILCQRSINYIMMIIILFLFLFLIFCFLNDKDNNPMDYQHKYNNHIHNKDQNISS